MVLLFQYIISANMEDYVLCSIYDDEFLKFGEDALQNLHSRLGTSNVHSAGPPHLKE